MSYTRDYTGLPVLEPPQLVLVRRPDSAKCGECGGDAVSALRADRSGYSMGSDHLHARTCSSISCPHGKLHSDPCDACEAEAEAERLVPLAIEAAVESLQGWAYSDSCVELDDRQLRQCLVDDVGTTGTAMLSEAECQEFICGDEDNVELAALKRRFPSTDAWLEEQWA